MSYTKFEVAGRGVFDDPEVAQKQADEANREQAIVRRRQLAHVRAQRAQLKDEELNVGGIKLKKAEIFPEPAEPGPISPQPVEYEKVWDVVSSRDGEHVIIGVDERTAESEMDRLNAEVSGQKIRKANRGSPDPSNPDDYEEFELPPHPDSLNAGVTEGHERLGAGPLTVRERTEYIVSPREVRVNP